MSSRVQWGDMQKRSCTHTLIQYLKPSFVDVYHKSGWGKQSTNSNSFFLRNCLKLELILYICSTSQEISVIIGLISTAGRRPLQVISTLSCIHRLLTPVFRCPQWHFPSRQAVCFRNRPLVICSTHYDLPNFISSNPHWNVTKTDICTLL